MSYASVAPAESLLRDPGFSDDIFVLASTGRGGIADYTHDQANALHEIGLNVTVLCAPSFLEGRDARYHYLPTLRETDTNLNNNRFIRRVKFARVLLSNMAELQKTLQPIKHAHLLIHFFEYLAPFWSNRLLSLAKNPIWIHTILHDPNRDYKIGPNWWHKSSLKAAFAPIDTVFAHTDERGDVDPSKQIVCVPFGVNLNTVKTRNRAKVRMELGVPINAPLLIAFGFIRDNKNLDRAIEALADLKDFHLLVAGPEQGGDNKKASHYREIADQLGVSERVIWRTNFLPHETVADYLNASDLALLTYSRSFISSSAALSMSLSFRTPCLVSSGAALTRRLVEKYRVGIWVEPDSTEAITDGLQRWRIQKLDSRWEDYELENSWQRNAELVRDAMAAAELGRP